MRRAAILGARYEKLVDWAVFGLGAFALTTAILATALGAPDDRLADADTPAPVTASLL